jgi:hypothetical protein
MQNPLTKNKRRKVRYVTLQPLCVDEYFVTEESVCAPPDIGSIGKLRLSAFRFLRVLLDLGVKCEMVSMIITMFER